MIVESLRIGRVVALLTLCVGTVLFTATGCETKSKNGASGDEKILLEVEEIDLAPGGEKQVKVKSGKAEKAEAPADSGVTAKLDDSKLTISAAKDAKEGTHNIAIKGAKKEATLKVHVKTQTKVGEQNAVTAIDILLEPDATMINHAEAANKLLLKNFPKGFALGKTHQPHISCLQRFVKTADLDKVYAAVGKVLAEEKPTSWKLKAYKYAYLPWNDNYLAALVIEPTDELLRYQTKLVSDIAPFTVNAGTAAAFVTTKEEPDINQATINWVEKFVPDQTDKKFIPHVTIGMASEEFLKKLVSEKFEAFTFSPAGVSIYHLGNFGTARTKLKGW
jgi:hypothetical protein